MFAIVPGDCTLDRSSELAKNAGSTYAPGSYAWYPDLRDPSLFTDPADGTRRSPPSTPSPEESGRLAIAGVDPACMLRLRWCAAAVDPGRAYSGCSDCWLDARDGERSTLGTRGDGAAYVTGVVGRSPMPIAEGGRPGVRGRLVYSPAWL